MGLFGFGKTPAGSTPAAIRLRQQKAVATDMKARGGNPVRLADLRQRHATAAPKGAAIRSRLLARD
jgi:hypothetical protein